MLTTNTQKQSKAAHPSVIFGNYSQDLAAGIMDVESLKALVPEIVDVLWTNQRLADAFLADKKSWQKEVAKSLDVFSSAIEQAIKAFGSAEFKKLVSKNPAGTAPVVLRPQASMLMTDSVSGCPNPSLGCNTNSTCGSCACGTGGCNTAHCQSGGCGTYICIAARKHSPNGPK